MDYANKTCATGTGTRGVAVGGPGLWDSTEISAEFYIIVCGYSGVNIVLNFLPNVIFHV